MGEKKVMTIAVRELIEFILRSGDIVPSSVSPSRALDGTKAHQKIQSQAPDNYMAEVPVQYIYRTEDFDLLISGRIDGVIEEEVIIIDEIKSTSRLVEEIKVNDRPLHWAQGEAYAYMYAFFNGLSSIKVQLTYINIHDFTIRRFLKTYKIDELEEKFYAIVRAYEEWARLFCQWEIKKYVSIQRLQFPFSEYRSGQKKLLKSVYETIINDNKLFLRAPTGIGKTMGTIFPALKALEKRRKLQQIFYLTAKTIGREVAEKAFQLLKDKGLRFKSITLTAKEKVCLQDEVKCDPEVCPYTKGHYDRVNGALLALYVDNSLCTRETIIDVSKTYKVCPFELQLDFALFADGVICDYNYAFDPKVMLKRFFLESNQYIFLVDEAHNLADRAREMFSASITKQNIVEVKKKLKGMDSRLTRYLNKMDQAFLNRKTNCEENNGFYSEKEMPSEIIDYARGVIHRIEHLLNQNTPLDAKEEVLEFYFLIYDFVRKSDLYDKHYVTYYEEKDKDIKLKLFCVDPSFLLRQAFERAKASIIFSATLIPLDYYVRLLGGSKESYGLILNSPFRKEHMCLMIQNGISTKYRDREASYDVIVQTILEATLVKKGNYLVFFPSYAYLNEISQRLINKIEASKVILIEQRVDMNEVSKEEFLRQFKPNNDKTLIGLAVLGGVFSEGIDLVGERLEGVIVTGVGLPGIGFERDLIKTYYENPYEGYQYAYMYPGMNKVMQAVGRVIRTEEDKGMVLLIDERYGQRVYRQIFPDEWKHGQFIRCQEEIKNMLSEFWRS